VGRLLV